MLKGTIDFCHIVSVSVTLTMAEGYKVNAKRNLLASFLAHFSYDQDGIWNEAINIEYSNTTFEWDLLKQ